MSANITSFTINSSTIRVTDPCYTKDVWCSGIIDNVLVGDWFADTLIFPDSKTGWGDRIAEIFIWHKDYSFENINELTEVNVGVDSGQAGFFDDSQYPDGETGEYGDLNTFYGKVCAGTAGQIVTTTVRTYDDEFIEEYVNLLKEENRFDEKHQQIVQHMKERTRTHQEYNYLGISNVGFGVASHSGYGDGGYECYVKRNDDGQIVAAKIVFIDEDENEDDEDMPLEDAMDIIIDAIKTDSLSDDQKDSLVGVINKVLEPKQ
jgi:hypothetical protein